MPGTYICPAETGLYYLWSRYYDPQTGRFINADAYASTGQGALGYNMFAYCANDPVLYSDPSGKMHRSDLKQMLDESGCTALAVTGTVFAGGLLLENVIQEISDIFDFPPNAYKDVYEYRRLIKVTMSLNAPNLPHVHHIVPVGTFSRRSEVTKKKISEMHTILAKAGINRWIDPINLIVVSSRFHASLHTDAYIDHVYSYISPAAGNKEAIYAALFYLRLEIAARDLLAWGY